MLSGDRAGSTTTPVARDGSPDGSALMYSSVPADSGASHAAVAGSVDCCSSPPPAVSTAGDSPSTGDAASATGAPEAAADAAGASRFRGGGGRGLRREHRAGSAGGRLVVLG